MADKYKDRQIYIKALIVLVGLVFVVRLGVLQIFETKKYQTIAEQQALRNITIYPARGLVYDRNGKLLVYNDVVYDLMVVPKAVKELDTADFCRSLGIEREEFEARMNNAKKWSPYSPSPFMKQISKNDYAKWQNVLYRFPGFFVQTRTLRLYPQPIAAHVLGYVGEVDENGMKKNEKLQMGDYVGKSGLEKTYEEVLCGKKGHKKVHVDVHGLETGSYRNGAFDTLPEAGQNLYSTIDADLQAYAEELMANKRGCVVAIEPSTGEVLALVSAPSYDPNLLVGRVRGENYMNLLRDISKPLYNRALQGQYPPGSIFKVAQAMIALDLGVITPNSGFTCDKSLVGCHNHPSARSVQEAIKMSCNPYFYQVYRRIIQQGRYKSIYKDSQYGLTVWRDYMLKFGFGRALDIDLPSVATGRIPDTGYYNKWYGREKWAFSTIYSNSIGQGEVEVVPLQMANLACIVANRGYYYIPHLVRYYGEDSTRVEKYYERQETGVEKEYFDIAARGMYDVVHGAGGTGHRADVPGIAVCGKTGTAENYGNDHSVFISFAPMEDPKIAMAVYVENAQGGGGTWAAPISGLIIEKYLKGKVEREGVEKMYKEINPCQKLPLTRRIKKPKKKR